jgi:hypothetical protein
MLAIGSGAKEESLRFIELLGVRNILIDSRPATSQEEFQQRSRDRHRKVLHVLVRVREHRGHHLGHYNDVRGRREEQLDPV